MLLSGNQVTSNVVEKGGLSMLRDDANHDNTLRTQGTRGWHIEAEWHIYASVD